MQKTRTIAVLGAGNGGQAMAADLTSRGLETRLWNRSREKILPLVNQGGIKLEGLLTGFANPALITTNLEAAVSGADLIMVVVTADAHRQLARQLSPFLRDGQIVILNPGRTGGALEVSQVFQEEHVQARVYIAEAQSLPYACRISKPGAVRVTGIKKELKLAALPATDTSYVIETASACYPSFQPAQHVLETSLGNVGAIFHPAVALFNASRIEAAEPFLFYNSVTPQIASFLERLDRERLEVGQAFGLELSSASNWLTLSYDNLEGNLLYDRIKTNTAYQSIAGPTDLNTRLLSEEVPTGLIPLSALGRLSDVPTPLCSSLAILASALTGKAFHDEGRTLARMGIRGMTVENLTRYVLDGRQPREIERARSRQLGLKELDADTKLFPGSSQSLTSVSKISQS